ncbi:glycoside hydrolase family 3 C-terminal domain-containing protein [Photobacterium sp. BZF1]|uniref:glycoside hydrolase family 3 protein n=1 Tax=Photobacterium sp. BZF1 TaxID=1904457 RepID=UPI001653BB23|nr:glycoside hydrolase family 3 protein [Photobacterium sp. BZF1]MBC7002411.1 glycoside hydrolase family 3 C-terminal domain-containing protein [Photobacterium sp. BZF1]
MTTFNTPYFPEWPRINSAIKTDPAIENAVADIVSQMTLEEKVGQMIQPDLRGVTPAEARDFKLGSILNGGGAWPQDNKHASAQDWANKADEFWFAVEEAYADRPFRVPFFWATDAVHGHNNVFGSTVFPHNIGLGCARDPQLIRRIGEVTAIEVASTGLDWTFAPTVATPRELNWGRVYEGYSEDPEITFAYASQMVAGLQGSTEELMGEDKVISNVKHWVGDGGTLNGVDRGINTYSEDNLRNIHAMGYFSGLEAGAQVVMSSFNSWVNEANYDQTASDGVAYNHKIHGSRYLLTDVLKGKMGFDGLVVTDWHGHAEVSKCTDTNASYAINAGNDILMVPEHAHWIPVYQQTVQDVKDGVIPMSRIDDAVTRILRVKMRAGLWDKPQPTKRKHAGLQNQLGASQHREVAREAVRKSLVLLKNNNNILPLQSSQKILLAGSAANDLQKQSGGWNLTWQGDENTLEDFPGATTTKMAFEAALGEENVVFDPELATDLSGVDIAIVAFGEDPYAEMMGDIKDGKTLEFAKIKRSYQRDTDTIRRLHDAGVKVVSVFFSGRPLYVNEEISKSEAFVAAWLPGSEGLGITDVLVGDEAAKANYDFIGKLSFSWPNKKTSTSVHRIPPHIPNYVLPANEQDPSGEHAPLFPYGYGLSYTDSEASQARDLNALELDNDGSDATDSAIEMFGVKASGDYQMKLINGADWQVVDASRNNKVNLAALSTRPFNYQQQQDAMEVTFHSKFGAVCINPSDGLAENLSDFACDSTELVFDVLVFEQPTDDVEVAVGLWGRGDKGSFSDISSVEITPQLKGERDVWQEIRIPLSSFENRKPDFSAINTPFMLYTEGELKVVIANVRWVK